jgi:hypothetical protein
MGAARGAGRGRTTRGARKKKVREKEEKMRRLIYGFAVRLLAVLKTTTSTHTQPNKKLDQPNLATKHI